MYHYHYALCGAFDRHNYGDILFPLLHAHFLRQQLGNDVDIGYYAVKAADLTSVGGVASESMETLYRRIRQLPQAQRVIFCGGDVLSADWVTMVGQHLSNDLLCQGLALGRRVLGFRRTNKWLRRLYQQSGKYPYVMDPAEGMAGIHYTGVGGSGFNPERNPGHLHEVGELLTYSDTLSMRDQPAVDQFRDIGITPTLVPDTALIMSDAYSAATLSRLTWQDEMEVCHGFAADNYIVFQAARTYLANRRQSVSRQLAILHANTGLSILLLPIGRATGHSDAQALEALYTELKRQGVPCALQNSPHVLHIMASLALSRGYIGTSLHGAISAYAFGHKVCGIATKRVKKLHSYLITWLQTEDGVSVADMNFLESFTRLIAPGIELAGKAGLAEQKAQVYAEMQRYLPEGFDAA